jgi:hypothetical protein
MLPDIEPIQRLPFDLRKRFTYTIPNRLSLFVAVYQRLFLNCRPRLTAHSHPSLMQETEKLPRYWLPSPELMDHCL